VLLAGAHERAARVVRDGMHVVSIPVQVGDGAVVVARVEHEEVDKLADAEGAPDAQVVIHFHLADRHPFKVGAHGIHLTLVHRHASVVDEGAFGIIELGRSVAVGIVSYLVVIPDGDPGELLVASDKIEVGPVSGNALPVVVEGEDLLIRLRDTA